MKQVAVILAIAAGLVAVLAITKTEPMPRSQDLLLPGSNTPIVIHPRRCPLRRPWRCHAEPEPMIDVLAMPPAARPKNCGGRPEPGNPHGSGLCVFTSIQWASWWQNEARLKDFQAKMRNEIGGGWPQKVDKMIAKYGAGTPYIQYEGKDPSIIELALKTGRLPCVTWGGNHMLCCVHLDATRAAILDNNEPERVQWMSRDQFLSKWTQPPGGMPAQRSGWVVVLLAPPPPPPPRSGTGTPRSPFPPRQSAPARCPCGPDCPIDCDCGCRDQLVFHGIGVGVAQSVDDEAFLSGWRIGTQLPICHVNGQRVPYEAIAAALVDDSVKPHLTVIGPPQERQAALAELASEVPNYLVQEYGPDAWETRCGFVVTGRPTVYLQARDGRVIFRRDAIGKPGDLLQGLRIADPTYDPLRDPRGTKATGLDDLKDWAFANRKFLAVLAVGAVGFWVLRQPPAGPAQPAPAPPQTVPAPPNPVGATRPKQSLREIVAEVVREIERQRPPQPPEGKERQ